ncbi:ATP phosphoribosyltransferase regulatory subunit [Rubellimicrobium mesophilum DSM 19309]|uniref:Histidine--tRNA ligase n=1 Tax=Rubellimicrobium mesophilum DSM 19309 TaxID=442562 RepID=A0A017HTU8_9RHOB|nr:ATP phosphoribosyltransferase regulatory subunit [Rubellimicrobium mesophilum]EYD77538.1 ATP phosphoribosyltransferase regulatory subunit [Rubellimicrobium mesophilum DSM 19309]
MTLPARKTAARAEAQRLLRRFRDHGAEEVEARILQPAEELLDLYGEDIRARAFVTQDPLRGEMMLRPDFTVPVVRMHMEAGLDPARYAYAGEVFRAQDTEDESRPSEYLQAGFEVFGGTDPAEAEAEVFAVLSGALPDLHLRAAMGDIGLLLAAVDGLATSEPRKAALRRHVWRPRRFRALLDRYAGRAPLPAGRVELLAHPDPLALAEAGPEIGLRSREEVEARVRMLREDAATPPLADEAVDLIDAILSIAAPARSALATLRGLGAPSLAHALDRLERRLDALERRGVDPNGVAFEGSFGRTTLEYYDGFVFGLFAEGRPDLPPVATGGRYDALTRVLGRGRAVPAVGGVIRPELVVRLRKAR